jgi:SRSO17 transposase
VIGHADRARPLWDYCAGLIMPRGRKSVEPMAAVMAPERVATQHQSLLHFANQAPWLDEKVLAMVREMWVPALLGACTAALAKVVLWTHKSPAAIKQVPVSGRRC